MKSPFERVAQLPALRVFLPESNSAAAGKKTAGEEKLRARASLRGLIGASKSLAAGALAQGRRRPAATSIVLAVVDGPDTALELIDDLRAFQALSEDAVPSREQGSEAWADHTSDPRASLPEDLKQGLALETTVFPAWDVLPTESDRPEGVALAGRRRAVERLREIQAHAPHVLPNTDGVSALPAPQALVIAAPVTALMQPCEAPGDAGGTIVLRAGDEHDPITLGRKLGEMGFERVGQVEIRGEFSLRGGILDIFPYTAERPYRIDFFGETIEAIHVFDPLTQLSEGTVPAIGLADSSPQRLRQLFSAQAGGPHTLLDHLPADAAIVWMDVEKLRQRAALYTASLVSGKSVHVDFESLRASSHAKFDTLDLLPPVAAEATDPDFDHAPIAAKPQARQESEVACASLQRLQGEPAAKAEAWKRLAAARMALYVFCETPGDRKRLEALLKDARILPAPTIRFATGRLSGSFDLRACGIAAIGDREILGRRKHGAAAPRVKARRAGGMRPISSILELQHGDYVVHASHGIARYLGISRLEKSGRKEDYLTLLFAEGVKLYVPGNHIGLVGKYIGSHAEPELSKLGSKAWARKKERAQKLLKDIAEDLLRVQAARRSLPGIVCGPDGEWQRQFEEAFPYEETPDQAEAIEAVREDMQATFPMDRLLCGDVGFGKTEVAVRAAFRTVTNGRQVAVLCPTTLLCEQHGRTFRERMAGYPVAVETLSRFKSKRAQRSLLAKLEAGRVDVAIGTHRLLQKDVRFKDLGLAIVDEEQRFGVEHKEFFKQLRKSVNVLTLSATPIPRTLHMAMLGLRDISNLQTPPQNRKPVVTKVARMSDDLVRRAVLREVSRGGQVFIVHPRVHDIRDFASKLAALVPEARFEIGHGQMEPSELEAVMERFLQHDVDVLVSTTIVESGLDIPSANTILVHDAGRFGLAELHQLRGRVGRSDIQAYCYLLLPEALPITPEGLRRLQALEEFDELGAGFQLALKDLEIRGAGNLLGAEQSGSIADVGYELYCRLLDSTVREAKGEDPPEEEIEVALQLRGAAYLPETYIEDEKAVLEFYRRLAACRGEAELEELKRGMSDRFGDPPEAAVRLFEEAKLRRMARAARVPFVGLDKETGRLIVKLHGWDLKLADRALRGLPEARDVRILDGETLTFGLSLKAQQAERALHEFVRHLFEPLVMMRRKLEKAPLPAPQAQA